MSRVDGITDANENEMLSWLTPNPEHDLKSAYDFTAWRNHRVAWRSGREQANFITYVELTLVTFTKVGTRATLCR